MSEEIDFLGKKYISSKRASEISGYANDYIGQLCRDNKIRARRVNRNWFIDYKFFIDYCQKNGRLSTSSKKELFFNFNKIATVFILVVLILVLAGGNLILSETELSINTIDTRDITASFVSGISGIRNSLREFKNAIVSGLKDAKEIIKNMFADESKEKNEIQIFTKKETSKQSKTSDVDKEISQIKKNGFSVQGQVVQKTIVEKTIERVVSGLSDEELDARLEQLNNKLMQEILGVKNQIASKVSNNYNASLGSTFQAVAYSQKIDNLSGVTINNATFTGTVSGLSLAGDYLPLSGGTLTSALIGTDLTLSGTLSVSGTTTLSATTTLNGVSYVWPSADGTNGQALSTNGSGTLTWSSVAASGGAGTSWEINAGGLLAPTTTLSVLANSNLFVTGDLDIYGADINLGTGLATSTLTSSSGNLGLGTTSPGALLSVAGTGAFDSWVSADYFLATSTTASSTLPMIVGGSAAGDNLFLGSTLNATKGNILFGTSVYDEVNNRLGIGTTSPAAQLSVKGDLFVSLSGTVSVSAGTATVTGVGTLFTTQLIKGDAIKIAGETFTVSSITSNTSLSLDSNHISGASGVIAYKDSDFFAIEDGDSASKFKISGSGHIGIGFPPASTKLISASKTFNTTASVYSADMAVYNYGAGSVYGINADGVALHSAGTMPYVFGGYYYGQQGSTGTVTNLEGIHAMTGGGGTGNVTYNTPIDVMWNLTPGTTNTARGIWIEALGGSGTATNVYGIQIDQQTKGTTTYQIYSAGGNTYFGGTGSNYFGGDIHNMGNIGIGTTTPAYKLDIKSLSAVSTEVFSGTGVDDMTSGGAFLGTNLTQYKVEIDGISSPNTFKWSDDGGSTWDATGVAMTGSAQTLNNGVTVTFNLVNPTIGAAWFNDMTGMRTLDDMTSGGTYTGSGTLNYWVEIDGESPDTFKWSDNNGAPWDAIGVAITGLAQTLNNGVTVTFGSTSGTHYISDYWTFSAENHVIGDNWTFNATSTNPFSVQDGSGTRIFNIGNDGNVGIGTTTPYAKLSIEGISTGTTPLFMMSTSTASATTTSLIIDSNGLLGIGSSTPFAELSVLGKFAIDGLASIGVTSNPLCLVGKDVMVGTGADCTASSERYKYDIQDQADALPIIMSLHPTSFKLKATDEPRLGLIAEEVYSVEPRLADLDKEGLPASVRYAELTSVLTKAIQEMNLEISNLKSQISNPDETNSSSISSAISESFSWVLEQFRNIGIVIADGVIRAKEFIADKITTKELCLEDVCINKNQLKELLDKNQIQNSAPEPQPQPQPEPQPEPLTPEVVEVPTDSVKPEPVPEITPELAPIEPLPEIPAEETTISVNTD